MVILGYFLKALAAVLSVVLTTVMWLIIAAAVISWVNPDPSNVIVRFLRDSTEPLLRPIRRFVPLIGPGIDFSPMILLLVIIFLNEFLVGVLMTYSRAMLSPVVGVF